MTAEPIAIIGSGSERYDADGFYHPDGLHHGSSNVRHAYTLTEDVRHFDASFFQISANEAAAIDPQQRLLLEVVYEALESAGQPIEDLRGSDTAVIVGQMCADYNDILTRDLETMPTYFATGTSRAIMANRVSYAFDWHGPSWTIDTACSSSLVAVHQAVQLLRAGDSRVAIAAGSNLLLGPEPYIAESKLKMLSPDGRSRMWGANANGYARGDGVAAVVLKTLSAALEDGDSIECIIRATGVNQDGRTKGITMPSSAAQAELIRKTYEAAGLSPLHDRPQYFEAHGTGTKAGDPLEAGAIFRAFFGNEMKEEEGHERLCVGSIKTIIGHTEGTAGLAGLLKASLALQHAQIPPNMHFHRLNPDIEPYWSRLQIPTTLRPWPSQAFLVRRASVNSFGFGGTNAHSILENYPAGRDDQIPCVSGMLPFVFSAQSESALAATMERLALHLHQNPDIDLRNLAWTLYARRSLWPIRASCFGASASALEAELMLSAEKIRNGKQSPAVKAFPISRSKPRVLGVFTGQGAQWPAMARELIRASPWLEQRVDDLERALSRLPEADRPTWSLKEEMLSSTAKVEEAILSQPLCTAVQILLVDSLRLAGIEFASVVGHSSGEIAAAYAAECLSAEAAICIAYYRGLHTKGARGAKGEVGGMLAVGTSLEDAEELCALPTFAGRLAIAASNSASSLTLSGDRDAIYQAHLVFQDEKKFSRPLKVDKAYHSHHMLPCAGPYGDSLDQLQVRASKPRSPWYSSVYDGDLVNTADGLCGPYWVENMCRPVCFSQALTKAIEQTEETCDLVIEVGPHPALKGPASSTIQEILGRDLPYTGLLQRGSNDAKAFSDALGFIWARFGRDAIDFSALQDTLFDGTEQPRLVKDLPSYPWDHSRVFWHESRAIQADLFREIPPHPLLGVCKEVVSDRVQWRNILTPHEISWLKGHALQGQTIFPASGYISMAIEAGRTVMEPEGTIALVEVQDLVIDRPLTFEEDSIIGVEVLVTLAGISREIQEDGTALMTATFTCHTPAGRGSTSLVIAARGGVCVTLDAARETTLPPAREVFEDLIQVDQERFYDGLKELGYQYTGPFKALDQLARYLNLSTGVVYQPQHSESFQESLLVHPAMLDASFQSVFLAYSWPGDGRLWSLHVPMKIRRVQVNPVLCTPSDDKLFFHTEAEEGPKSTVHGHITLSRAVGEPAAIRVDQITVIPVAPASVADDRALFASEVWDDMSLDDQGAFSQSYTVEEDRLGRAVSQLAEERLRQLLSSGDDQCETLSRIANHLPGKTTNDGSCTPSPAICSSSSVDLALLEAVTEFVHTGRSGDGATAAGKLHDSDLMDRYFEQGFGVIDSNSRLAMIVRRLSHRYPLMNILELNANNTTLTETVLRNIHQGFSSYTVATPQHRVERMKQSVAGRTPVKVSALDRSRDVEEQEFPAGHWDLVIGSLVLDDHRIEDTLKTARRLLRPGGYLSLQIVGEASRFDLYFDIAQSLPLTIPQWRHLLKQNGFSGIDAFYQASMAKPLGIVVTQATDERVALLQQPLLSTPNDLQISELVIVGGTSLFTSNLIDDLLVFLSPRTSHVTLRESIADVQRHPLQPLSTVICLSDLDNPVFSDLRPETWTGLKSLFDNSQNLLWLLSGARGQQPYPNATVGFGRTLRLEMPHVNLQFLDLGDSYKAVDGRSIAEHLLRLCLLGLENQARSKSPAPLWSNEPELLLTNGRVKIPRVIPHAAQNNRYNSSKRSVNISVNPTDVPVSLSRAVSGAFNIHLDHTQNPRTENTMLINVTYSAVQQFAVSDDEHLYLVIGHCSETGQRAMAFAPMLASQIAVPRQDCFVLKDDHGSAVYNDFTLIQYILKYVHMRDIVSQVQPGATVVYFSADKFTRRMLSKLASARKISVVWVTTGDSANEESIHIHPRSSLRDLEALIPRRPSVIVDLSDSREDSLQSRQLSEAYGSKLFDLRHLELLQLPSLFDEDFTWILDMVKDESLMESPWTDIVKLNDLPEATASPFTIVDWNTPSVSAEIEPAETQPLLRPDCTYLLVGLTGGLGQSLCEWMVRHGARHLVLTSRKPKIDERWVKALDRAGAVIKLVANDITDSKSVRALYDDTVKTCPPIAGVVNGAMVLHDSSIYDMDVEMMLKVLRPKIDGSRYLDALFQENTLDFFIMLSSLTGACGNSGQSNYTAANMFMAGLAAQRKQKGLAGSVIDIGAMMGVGVLVRDRSYALQVQLREYGYLWMSERDFHHSFAEAILAGRPDNDENPQVMAGIRLCRRDQLKSVQWADNPRFGHCILPSESDSSAIKQTSGVPLATQVAEAANGDEVRRLLEDAFLQKLVSALSLPELDAGMKQKLLSQGVDELGVDSLVAVDIRSWWLKELRVDMPVLKIMGGTAITDLIEYGQKQIALTCSPQEEASSPAEKNQSPSTSSDNESEADKAVTTPQEGSVISSATTATSDEEATEIKLPPLVHQELMSYGQRRFWFLGKYLSDKTTFNIACLIRLKGRVQVGNLAHAVRTVGQKHSALRTCFFEDEHGQSWQGILEHTRLKLESKSIQGYEYALEEFQRMRRHVFDLTSGESMRVILLSESAESHYLLIGYHHINMDGISLQVVLRDLETAYLQRPWRSDPLEYHQFATWQRNVVESGALQADITYWREELSDMPDVLPILSISTTTVRQLMQDYSHNRADFKVPQQLGARIKAVARKHRATSFHFYLATFKALLYRFSGVEDLVIGMADGNRNHLDGAMDGIGIYLNLLPVRLSRGGKEKFAEHLTEARAKSHAALSHSKLPIDVLLEELQVARSASYTPIFQAFVNYRQGAQEILPFGDCQLEGDKYEIGRTGYDISLDVIENAQSEATVMLVTQKYLYSEQQTEILAASFQQLLDSFSQDAELEVDAASMYSREKIREALQLSRGPEQVLQWKGTIVDRIDEMVARYPTRPALSDDQSSLTYKQMSARIHTVAAALANLKLTPGAKVAVFQQPSVDWICSMLAILRLGAVYVPFDPRLSLPRLQRIAQDCQPEAIVFHSATSGSIPELTAGMPESLLVDVTDLPTIGGSDATNLSTSEFPMVILYTSGSTGLPKGVVLQHSSLAMKIETITLSYNLDQQVRIMQQSALTFDMSIAQTFMGLCNGGEVVVVPRAKRGDPAALVDTIIQHNITHTMATPSEYISWLQYINSSDRHAYSIARGSWKTLFSGGEAIPESLKQKLRAINSDGLQLHNVYGPTEISIFSHSTEVDYHSQSKERIPVGPVNPNYSAFVVDEQLTPVPIGVPGEIVIAGSGVALGYLNNDDLTRENFVQLTIPYGNNTGTNQMRAYRTGDRGRLRHDGALCFEGRIGGDTQIKLRGLRMDLVDIESALIEVSEGILLSAVVTVRGPAEAQYLLAHVVPNREWQSKLTLEQQQAFFQDLKERLPLPHSHGKVDRGAIRNLPIPENIFGNVDNVGASLSEAEEQVKRLWEEVLPSEVARLYQIGPFSDFFHVGGNSMLLVKLQQAIRAQFGRIIPLVHLFESTTLAKMTARITDNDVGRASDTIDWSKEIEIDPAVVTARESSRKPVRMSSPDKDQTIVLTGATGFLGQVLLHQLLENDKVSMVHCIGVRSPTRLQSFQSPKLAIHEGDLASPHCGLSQEASDKIFTTAHAVIHNGADVHFLKSYQVLRPVNVDSTKWLAAQALSNNIPFHYVSTASVIQYARPSAPFPPSSVNAFLPPTDGRDGYTASKWASEQYLEQLSTEFGLNVHIHRPTAITGPNTPAQDIFPNVMRFSREIKAVPVFDFVVGHLDFIDVHSVATRILQTVAGAAAPRSSETKGPRFYHHSGEVVIQTSGLRDHLQRELNDEVVELGVREWVDNATQAGMDSMVGEYMKSLEGLKEPIFLPQILPS
ncbi:uncharacterized protein CDV56_101092 [Aspergillus thermomutatus]|uniref:Carrier domain-containing protein n=1 Tax=Aspergillus thermomutatus TaxID=41047 RepID=A0A397G1Z4_ASPTH|nr:uncharacterized protein CDV56_101092 [Aspergillus thermomutatus]RHZ44089.1 hypothetical protein CDV56_101092 [Aspergillus thermomutatus]